MATRYFDSATGNDANDGLTAATAWRTVYGATQAAWLAAITAGDVIYLGTMYPDPTSSATFNVAAFLPVLSSKTGVTVSPTNGSAVIRGDAPVSVTWTNTTGNTWTATLPTGLYIDAITFDYDNKFYTGKGGRRLHNGNLRYNAAPSAAWSWSYNSGTGLATIVTDGTNPNTVRIGITRGRNAASPYAATPGSNAYNGIVFSSCTNCYVTAGFQAYNINPYSTADGYAVLMNGCTGCEAWGVTTDDTGYHAGGGAGAGAQANLTFYGWDMGACYKSSTHLVVYASGANNTVSGIRYLSCVAHVVTHKAPDSTPIESPVNLCGYYAHTGAASGNVVTGLLMEGCKAYIYDDFNAAVPFGITDVQNYTGTWDSTTGRQVIVRNCQFVDCNQWTIYHSVWFDRCKLDFRRNSAAGTAAQGAFLFAKISGINHLPLFTSCEIMLNADRNPNGLNFSFFTGTFASGDGPGFIGCSMIDVGTTANDTRMFAVTANFTIRCYGCIVGWTSKPVSNCYLMINDTGRGAGISEFRTCAYLGMSPTLNRWRDDTTYNTQTKWLSLIDSGTGAQAAAIVSTANAPANFYRIADSLELAGNSTLRRTLRNPSYKPTRGVNEAYYAGDYGAYQYPQYATSQRNAGRYRMARGR